MSGLRHRLTAGAALVLWAAAGREAAAQGQVIPPGNATVDLGLTFGIDDPAVLLGAGTILDVAAGDAIVAGTIAWTLTNLGTAISRAEDGIDIAAGGIVDNQGADAVIAGGVGGVRARAVTTVINRGSILGLGGGYSGVQLDAGGTVVNQAGALIAGNGFGVYGVSGQTTIANLGTITASGAGSAGVRLRTGGTLLNGAGGTVTGGDLGVRADTLTTVTNLGTIRGALAGVAIRSGGTVANLGTAALVEGQTGGIITTGSANVTNEGTVRSIGAFAGIRLFNAGTVINRGTVLSGGTVAVQTGTGDNSVILGNGSALIGDVLDNGTVGTDSLVLLEQGAEDSAFIGFESLAMRGQVWSLTGVGLFNQVGVETGTLLANGTLGGMVDVAPGARLGGSGRIIGSVANRGTLAPGNSIGTLTVMGAFSFAAGSVLEAEIAPDGSSDLLLATGAISIAGGTVSVLGGMGSFSNGQTFTIATGQTVTGTFDNVVDDLAFMDTALVYDGTSVDVALGRNNRMIGDVARTRNQRAVAGALDAAATAGNLGTLIGAVLALNDAQARAAFDSLSGDIHAGGEDAVLAAGERFARTVLRHEGEDVALGDDGEGARLWLRAFGGGRSVDGDGNAGGYDETGGGIAGGIAFAFGGGLEAGAAVGFESSSLDFDRDADGEYDILEAALYARFADGPFSIEGVIAFGAVDGSTTRRVTVGSLAETARGDLEGDQISGRLEASYAFDLGDNLVLQPMAALAFTSFDRDGFNERGAPATGLAVRGETSDRTTAEVGARLADRFTTEGGWTLTPEARAGLIFDLSDEETVSAAFLGAPDNGFTVAGPDHDGVGVTAGVGLKARNAGGLILFLDAEAALADGSSEGLATAGVKFSW